jgi:hypothetical protein
MIVTTTRKDDKGISFRRGLVILAAAAILLVGWKGCSGASESLERKERTRERHEPLR